MNLKQKRLAANLMGTQVTKVLKSIDPRIDAPLYSKMEAGLCLPTPEQFHMICQLLDADPASIYTKAEVDFGIGTSRPPRMLQELKHPDIYKLTVKVPKTLARGLAAKLSRNGYPSITAFVCDCIRKLK